eukprot:CAMPEP_0194227740 /NCGR_PEP_ID=MMETSP0156-20130528/43014_1 /TAXON_ID=33649 /ORGANISM="Thalassionema nitzschioides, Strain L26-B" /LENGTH=568 /DNA_ID=CAMNT_0038960233 /DNA_START=68 /DNA_END=1774 /DNA_ORIENTATION=+
MFGGRQRRLVDGVGIGLVEGPIARKIAGRDGPVSIPRGDRIQLRKSNDQREVPLPINVKVEDNERSAVAKKTTLPELQISEVQLPPAIEAANHPTWSGQTLEYAAGKSLRQQVLEPLLMEKITDDIPEEEASRLLSYFAKGHIMLLEKNCDTDNESDKVTISSMERVVQADGPNILESWWREGDLVLSHTTPEWSDWWIQQCSLFDAGCEMVKLQEKTTGVVLGVAYLERNTNAIFSNSSTNNLGVENDSNGVNGGTLPSSSSSWKDNHDTKTIRTDRSSEDTNDDESAYEPKNHSTDDRITLIRDIRVNPNYNASVLKRLESSTTEVEYPGILSALFHAILLQSLRYGTNGVGVSSPKSDAMEFFFETNMGRSSHRNPNDGKRWFQINAQQRFQLIQKAFREQLELLQRVLHNSQVQVDDSHTQKKAVDEHTEGDVIMESKRTNTAKRKEIPSLSANDEEDGAQQEETTSNNISITGKQEEEPATAATAGQATQEAGECPAASEYQQFDDGGNDNQDVTSDVDNTKRPREEQEDVDKDVAMTNKKQKLDVEEDGDIATNNDAQICSK